jgi:hypothetical protein
VLPAGELCAPLPQTLSDRGVIAQQWWQTGCDYFEHADAPPPLDAALKQRLDALMPHFSQDLLTHEYDKHVACFKFDPTTFFRTELAMPYFACRRGLVCRRRTLRPPLRQIGAVARRAASDGFVPRPRDRAPISC